MLCYIRCVRRFRQIVICLIVAYASLTQAQIHADLGGEALYKAVVESYKPQFVEIYSNARLLMYKEIYNVRDSVETLYSGHKLYLPPNEEFPIQFLAMNAQADGINAEHIYPRSKGAKEEYGNAFSDLHNLAPARWEVNSARSNFPFEDINDTQTEMWYKCDKSMIASSDFSNEAIDHYSEVEGLGDFNGAFEPREEVKGDVARSIMYFYTMYREEALLEDANFFADMQSTMVRWHNEDPVDSVEMERTLLKALVQDGKANPFILDCTLGNRLYGMGENSSSNTCSNLTTAIDNSIFGGDAIDPSIKIYPNPNNGIFTLDISDINPGKYQVDIYMMSGLLLYSLNEYLDYFNSINMWNARPGLHIIHLRNLDTGRKYSGLFKVVK
ncbi:MAG: endonuclease I [Saprospiraceae bacterium]|jgi:endonuclease I